MEDEKKNTGTGWVRSDEPRGLEQQAGATEFERHVVVVATAVDEPSEAAELPAAQAWEIEPATPLDEPQADRHGTVESSFRPQRIKGVLDRLRDFGRRHPVALTGGAVIAGVLAGLLARNRRNGAWRGHTSNGGGTEGAGGRLSQHPAAMVGPGRHATARSPYASRHY